MKLIIFLIVPILLFSSIGKVVQLKGNANLLRNNKLIPIYKGIPLSKGDAIHTYKRAKVVISLNDNTNITIGVSSKVNLDEFIEDGNNSTLSMRFTKGFFRTITGKIGKLAPKKFHIKTKTATMGIRGTTIVGHVSDEKEIIACLDGAISVAANDGEVLFAKQNYTQILHPNPPTQPKKTCAKEIKFFYHGLLEKIDFDGKEERFRPEDSARIIEAVNVFRSGAYKQSLLALDQLLIENPCISILHFYRGRSLIHLKEYKMAIEAFKNVLAYDKSHTKSLFFMAEAYQALNQNKRALKLYRRVNQSRDAQFKNYRLKSKKRIILLRSQL
jgi:hypothetical protein